MCNANNVTPRKSHKVWVLPYIMHNNNIKHILCNIYKFNNVFSDKTHLSYGLHFHLSSMLPIIFLVCKSCVKSHDRFAMVPSGQLSAKSSA